MIRTMGETRMAKKTKLRQWTKEDVRLLKSLARENKNDGDRAQT
jgi:hypothetical protein